jgi:hypothetical protein
MIFPTNFSIATLRRHNLTALEGKPTESNRNKSKDGGPNRAVV